MAAPTPRPGTPAYRNPHLTAALNAEGEALRNDLEQARELAAEYQRQLASKTNDFGALHQLFQKTMEDFAQLQASVKELREERHRLANEAMKGVAFERQLRNVTEERNRLFIELRELRKSIESPEWLEARLRECRASQGDSAASLGTNGARPTQAPQVQDSSTTGSREFIELPFDSPDSDEITVSF